MRFENCGRKVGGRFCVVFWEVSFGVGVRKFGLAFRVVSRFCVVLGRSSVFLSRSFLVIDWI